MEENKAKTDIQKKSLKQALYDFYEKKYKALLIIPFLIIVLSIGQIAYQIASTGDFMKKDVSLKGGITVTIPYDKQVDVNELEAKIRNEFPLNDITIRTLSGTAGASGLIFEADIDGNDPVQIDRFIDSISSNLPIDLKNIDYGLEITGSALGASFFRESFIALGFAFLFMSLVVLIYFRSFVPSVAIIAASFSEMIIALAVVNIMDIKIGTAGIAAFLMLIGYSVDTNILLTVRVLKRREGTVQERVVSSLKTGMTMTLTAIVTAIVGILLSESEVIRQIMTILLIGLLSDIVFTWIMNVGLLRMHEEKKAKKLGHG